MGINSHADTYDILIKKMEEVPLSSKTKIMVLHMKELIYTAIFVGLGILLVILLVCMFHKKGDEGKTEATMKYQAGVYTSSILFNDNILDVEVTVDDSKIKSIALVNLDESVATMYPLVEPALEELAEQIYEKQSLEDITYNSENQYTSMVLLNAIEDAVDKAQTETEKK